MYLSSERHEKSTFGHTLIHLCETLVIWSTARIWYLCDLKTAPSFSP